ncbi:hypothetical protein FYJ79_11675 [Sharpea azabuensis]|uniref:Uncharacterized protein n=1 Tax=Sharpea porci TaxID=2652286 RepID=A0A844FX49_9FIRM|nr:hypothetical protein [Sharpea porci]MST90213.1 hypothetical protein [Sharpea porci]
MINYLKGVLFLFGYLNFLYLLGTTLFPHKSVPYKIVAAYVINTFLLFIPGVIVQILKLSWDTYFLSFLIIDFLLIFSCIYVLIKRKQYLTKNILLQYLKDYWVVIVATLACGAFIVFYNYDFFYNGYNDDSYYLVKMASLPFMKNPFNANYETGFYSPISIFDVRNLNTHELEMSVYYFITRVTPTLFFRGFISFINRFLFVCTIYVTAERLNFMMDKPIKRNKLQYVSLLAIIAFFDYNALAYNKILYVRDGWIVNVATYYGSAVVMMMAFFWLFDIFFDNDLSIIKRLLFFVITSFTLVSKSGIVLPIIALSFISFILTILWNKNKKYLVIFILVLLGLSIAIENKISLFNLNYERSSNINYFVNNFSSIVFIPFIVIFILLVLKKYKNISFVSYVFSLFAISGLSPFNNIIELASQYSFVFGRMIASLFIFFVLVTSILIFFYFYSLNFNKEISLIRNIVLFIVIGCIAFGSLYAKEGSIYYIINELKVYVKNPYLTPRAVKELGERLQQIEDETHKDVYALVPFESYDGNKINTRMYYNGLVDLMPLRVAGAVRAFAPNIKSLTIICRWSADIENSHTVFDGFKTDDVTKYINFQFNPNKDNTQEFMNVLREYPINVVVMWDKGGKKELESEGFHQYGNTIYSEYANYYVYYRDS